MTHNNTHDTHNTINDKTPAQRLKIAFSIFERGLKNNFFTIISTYARSISDLEILLDYEVEDFLLRMERLQDAPLQARDASKAHGLYNMQCPYIQPAPYTNGMYCAHLGVCRCATCSHTTKPYLYNEV